MTQKLKASDIRLLDDLFGMGGGYVLDFSNKTFAEFFDDELGIDIDHPRYAAQGTSKAKRLRHFLQCSPDAERVKVLVALWNHRARLRRLEGKTEALPVHAEEFAGLIQRLGGKPPSDAKPAATSETRASFDEGKAQTLFAALMDVASKPPQERGYAFERFLKELFDANGLGARASFRLMGEQIDGSFVLDGETYLLEAKWQGPQVAAADLRSFNAKVQDKAAWSRGLFISDSGFSEDGLQAFGRGKSIICMDGLDLSESLQRKIPFHDLIQRKVRRCAETGRPFVRLRELL